MKLKIAVTIQTFVIVGLIALIGWLVYSQIPETSGRMLDVQDGQIVTEPREESGYRTTGDKIYLDVGGIGQVWLPVLEGVPVCERDLSQQVTRNGQVFYLDKDQITSHLGVDVSAYQGDIDWETVKASGIDFALIRCAYRGYGSGALLRDEAFDKHMQGALAAGLDVGVYCFSQAVTVEEAVEEADLTLSMLEGYDITYPVVFDWEVISAEDVRTAEISVEMLTDCAAAFCERVKAAGYIPMIYQNKRTSLLKLELPALSSYDFWLAEYADTPSYYYDYQIWQYCSDGIVPGIDGVVDMNICYKNYGE